MTENQQKVKKFIQEDRSLKGAIEIYNKLPNKNLAFLASINRMRSTEENCKKAAYHLCKAVGLDERTLTILWSKKIEPVKEEADPSTPVKKIAVIGSGMSSLAERILAFNESEASWREIQILAADISEETQKEAAGRKKDDLLPFIADFRAEVLKTQTKEIPLQVKESIKLREQFPFLEDKSCPMELKALVSDLITAYHNYKNGHAKLFESMTLEEEKALAADVVENFIENKEIFAELDHYAKTGEILGQHPIFEQKRIKEELSQLSAEELNKKEQALRTNISRNKSKAESESDPEKKSKYEKAVEDYTWQQEYVLSLIKKK